MNSADGSPQTSHQPAFQLPGLWTAHRARVTHDPVRRKPVSERSGAFFSGEVARRPRAPRFSKVNLLLAAREWCRVAGGQCRGGPYHSCGPGGASPPFSGDPVRFIFGCPAAAPAGSWGAPGTGAPGETPALAPSDKSGAIWPPEHLRSDLITPSHQAPAEGHRTARPDPSQCAPRPAYKGSRRPQSGQRCW